MKVADLRKILNNTNDVVLKNAFVEVYKLVPASKKEEADVIITNVLSGNTQKITKPKEKVDYKKLNKEVDTFLKNAYAQYYVAPNRVVAKKDRPKWRFLVKRYVKELDKVPYGSEYYQESIEQLIKLYKLMCDACCYYLFSTDDSFNSVGISQGEFYRIIVEKKLSLGYTSENITTLLIAASSGGLSRASLHIYQELILLSQLNDKEKLNLAINQAKELVDSTSGKIKGTKEYSSSRYVLRENVNNICDFILIASIKFDEFDDGIDYYFKHNQEREEEVILYCALDCIEWFDEEDNELWIKCYEYGVKKRKIKPRDYLVDKYKQKKEK